MTYTYDVAGNLKTQADVLSQTYVNQYDVLGRLETITRPDNNTEGYSYDSAGNMKSFANAKSKSVSFGYNALGLKTGQTNALDRAVGRSSYEYAYDAAGNLTNVVDALQETKYTYDDINRLKRMDYEDGEYAAFFYDENSNITTAKTAEVEVEYLYNEIDQLTDAVTRMDGNTFNLGYDYNAAGSCTNIIYPGTGRSVQYFYDSVGQVTNITAWGNRQWSFAYDANGGLTNIVYPNNVTGTLEYDDNDQLVSFSYATNGTAFIERGFERDLLGRKKWEDVNAGTLFAPATAVNQTRTNNDGDQLTALTDADNSQQNILVYTDVGCLTQEVVTVDANTLTNAYGWNCAGQLTSVISGADDSVTEYRYDATGSRVRSTKDGTTTVYVINRLDPLNRPLCETDASGSINRCYIWGPGGLLAQIDPVDGGGDPVVHYFHSDELGPTLALTDASGNVTDEFGYSPYGERLGHTGSTQTAYQWLGGIGIRFEDPAQQRYFMNRRY